MCRAKIDKQIEERGKGRKGGLMREAKKGDTVKLYYSGKIDDGTEFAVSNEDEPVVLTIGDGSVVPGFENGLIGMTQGQKRIITVPPEEGVGHKSDELIIDVNKNDFPSDMDLHEGMKIKIKTEDGDYATITVINIDEDVVTIDANSPFAGKTITFTVELVDFI